MQPRPSDSSAAPPNTLRRRRETPLAEHDHHLPPSTFHHSQTSLPSIRQLHPYLPLSMSQHTQVQEGSNFTYPPPPAYNPTDQQPTQPPSQRDTFGGPDSDAEGDTDHHGPPKKKRRRQALSCTGRHSPRVYMDPVTDVRHVVLLSVYCDRSKSHSVRDPVTHAHTQQNANGARSNAIGPGTCEAIHFCYRRLIDSFLQSTALWPLRASRRAKQMSMAYCRTYVRRAPLITVLFA
jgi:hypothetical protein